MPSLGRKVAKASPRPTASEASSSRSYQQALQYAQDAQRYQGRGKAYQQILIDYPRGPLRLKEGLLAYPAPVPSALSSPPRRDAQCARPSA